MKGEGRSRPRLQIEPNDHATAAISNATSPMGCPTSVPPALSQSTPTKPIASPNHSSRLGCWPRIIANNPIHSGADATATAASPDDTHCCAMVTRPLPSPSSNAPITAALRHCARVGAVSPRRRSTMNISPPAMTKREPAISSGGNPPSSAKRIARYVEPQMRYTAARASATASAGVSREAEGAMGFMGDDLDG
jgi:hypothetical protein